MVIMNRLLMPRGEGIAVGGTGTVWLWRAGVIPRLLNAGYSMRAARIMALNAGALGEMHRTHNLVVTAGKGLIADLLIDTHDGGLTYCALGTGTTAPAVGQTTLATEAARKAYTLRSRAANVVSISTFFLASEASYNIREVGHFGGPSAGASADSGTLFSRYLQSVDNAGGTYDLTFDYDLTIG